MRSGVFALKIKKGKTRKIQVFFLAENEGFLFLRKKPGP